MSVPVAYQRMTSPCSSQQRVVLDQEPTILTIPVANSSFVLEWDPSRDRRLAFVVQSLGILRMKDIAKAFRTHFFFRQAGVLQYCLICVQKFSVGPNSDDELRYCIDDCSKFSFGFGYFVESLRLAPPQHACARRCPSPGYTNGQCDLRHHAADELVAWNQWYTPSASTATMLNIKRLPGFDRAPIGVDHARKVIGMDSVAGGPILHFLNRLAEIFQDLAVDKFDLACRIRGRQQTQECCRRSGGGSAHSTGGHPQRVSGRQCRLTTCTSQ